MGSQVAVRAGSLVYGAVVVSELHVVPTNDLIEHETVGDDCACGPRVEFVPGGPVIVHHSLDGRELREQDA